MWRLKSLNVMTAPTWNDRLAFSFACTFRSHSGMLVLFFFPTADVLLERLEPFRTVALIILTCIQKMTWMKKTLPRNIHVYKACWAQSRGSLKRTGKSYRTGKGHSPFVIPNELFPPVDFMDIFTYFFAFKAENVRRHEDGSLYV